jgi:hypothetical protein
MDNLTIRPAGEYDVHLPGSDMTMRFRIDASWYGLTRFEAVMNRDIWFVVASDEIASGSILPVRTSTLFDSHNQPSPCS